MATFSSPPKKFIMFGFISVAVFMAGDGFEQAFLSHYIVSLGFSHADASMLFTLYGLCTAIAGWSAGILADMFSPKKIMIAGALIWIVFHSLFLLLGVNGKSYFMMVFFYCLRAAGYPLFVYAFVVWLARTVAPARLATAMGIFWTVFTFGLGTLGSFIPSFTLPAIGEVNTLWLSLLFVIIGAVTGYVALCHSPAASVSQAGKAMDKLRQLSRGLTLIFDSRSLACAVLVMAFAPMTIFGFAAVMPFFFIDRLGFTGTEWLRIWGLVLFMNMATSALTGYLSDRTGRIRHVRWQGCAGLAISTLLFYYVPLTWQNHTILITLVAILHGICLSGFTPLSALIPSLAPAEKGAAISLHNLAVGLGSFIGPGIATLTVPLFGIEGLVWVYSLLYVLALGLSKFIQPVPVKAVTSLSVEAVVPD